MAGKGHLIFKHGKWFIVLSIPIGDKKHRQKWVQLKAKTETEAKKEQNLLWTDREHEEWVEPKKYGILLMSMTTGMRIGKVLGLRWQDLDLQKGRIYVNQKLEKKEIGNPEI
jgi:integrase